MNFIYAIDVAKVNVVRTGVNGKQGWAITVGAGYDDGWDDEDDPEQLLFEDAETLIAFFNRVGEELKREGVIA